MTVWPAARAAAIRSSAQPTVPQFAFPLAFRCEMCTGTPAPLPTAIASSIALEQPGPLVADVRGIDAPVPARDPRQLDQLGRPGVTAGNVDQAGGDAPGAGPHARSTSCFIRSSSAGLGARSALPRMADRTVAVRDQVDDVGAGAVGVDRGEVLGDVEHAAAAVAR